MFLFLCPQHLSTEPVDGLWIGFVEGGGLWGGEIIKKQFPRGWETAFAI